MQKQICNVCGKEFDMWDKQEQFGFEYYVGYGSKHDGEHIQADICCDCFDALMADFIPRCKINPVVGEYDGNIVAPVRTALVS